MSFILSSFIDDVKVEKSGSRLKDIKYEVIYSNYSGKFVLARASSKRIANKFIKYITKFTE